MKYATLASAFLAATVFTLARAADAPPTPSTPPATQPAPSDATLDWLLAHATTAPAESADAPVAPATQPALLSNGNDVDEPSRKATLLMSNGEKIEGDFTTTPDQPFRVWDDAKSAYQDIPFDQVRALEANVEWERMEQEWKFAQSGSDVKEYSGKSYPTRLTRYTLTLTNGQQITGELAAPLYLHLPQGAQRIFILHKRDKGIDGQTLDDLVYVKRMDFKGE